jgi:thiol-disulfide isomerase/thioredoxin
LRSALSILVILSACASSAPKHGTFSDLTGTSHDLCEHRVPAATCARCNPELVPKFKAVGDWCPEHDVPESQCLICNPGLTFEPLPGLPADADVKKLSAEGEDVPSLEAHAVPGKVTLFDFYADWCAPCRQIDRHVFAQMVESSDLALRKINVVDWDTPVAKRHLANVPRLPYVVVYGRDGTLVRAIAGLDLPALDAAIAEGRTR